MKKVFAAMLLCAVLFPGLSCRKTVKEDTAAGTLMFKFESNPKEVSKISRELPDTNEFLITVSDESGGTVFDGVYRDLPETMDVDPGSYRIFVRSEDFSGLKFSAPQYGDEQCVVVPPAGTMTVELGCRQINSGIRLDISPDFLTEYPEGVLFIKAGGSRLMYSYSEKRIAYFLPGSILVVLSDSGKETLLMTRAIEAREVLSVKMDVAESQSGTQGSGITVRLDTSRIWTDDELVLGEENLKGDSPQNAMTV